MAIEWRPGHHGHVFDGYDGGMIRARVVRYADLDHEHGHAVRGHYWQAFVTGADAVEVLGRHLTPEGAMAAAEGVRAPA